MEIREAAFSDLRAVIELLADDALGAAREDIRDPLRPCYRDAFEAMASDPNQIFAVAMHDGTLVGCLQITFIPGLSHQGAWRGNIESVRVASSMRGRGLGKTLFEWAFARCRERGCRIVQLTQHKSRDDAMYFYRSIGFEPTHEGMKKQL